MSKRIAFVDPQVAPLASMLQSIYTDLNIVVLDDAQDVATQVADELRIQQEPVAAIDLFSHGAPGELRFSAGVVDAGALAAQAPLWQEIGSRLQPGGGVAVYGCETGADAAGAAFVQRLAALAEVPVRASERRVGAQALGGDWSLDIQAGQQPAPAALEVPQWEGVLAEFTGTEANDTVFGTIGDDIFYASLGVDILAGSTGNDTLIVDLDYSGVSTTEGLRYRLGNTTVTNGSTYDAIHTAIANTRTNFSILLDTNQSTQTSSMEEITTDMVGSQNNDLILFQGGTSYDGSGGTDTFYGDWSWETTDLVFENNPTVASSVGGVSVTGMERLLVATGSGNDLVSNTYEGNTEADYVDGGAGNDTVSTGAGNDTLRGGSGADLLVGGLGDDIYYVDDAADVVDESLDGGADKVYATADFTLNEGSHVEVMALTGSATALTGNELNNTLMGTTGSNTLSGMAGDDSLAGGAGNDTLSGGEGNDTLNGGAGDDSMTGGAGDDLYYVDSANDVIVEGTGGGTDKAFASADYVLANGVEVEWLVQTGSAISLTGNDLGNKLTGNSLANVINGGLGDDSLVGSGGTDTLIGGEGNDTLDGGSGTDRAEGGLGDDVYYVNAVSDLVVEAVGQGTDKVYASVNYALAAGSEVEWAVLTGTSATLTGNALNNTLSGNAEANRLRGMLGNDSLVGSSGDDTLEGSSGNDTLNGGADADTLFGGLDNDTMTGGAANDVFVFDTALNATTNVDRITDFTAGDLMSLDNDVFTALGAAGALSAGQFYSGAGLVGGSVAGQTAGIYYNTNTGSLYYDADGFGGAAGIKFAVLTGTPALTSTSFDVRD